MLLSDPFLISLYVSSACKLQPGGIGAGLLLNLTATVGFARLSQSGLAMNIVIDTQLHTVPMRSLTPVLTGQNRKAPLFVPAEDLEPDAAG